MELVFQIASLVFLGTGLILRVQCRKYRTEFGQSIQWYNVKYWLMPWATVDLLTKQGHRLFSTSTALIMLGLVSILAAQLGVFTTP
ncbi:MAG: hypothetical protein P1R58_10260 [bacterium]|nr:hypothetical protein [bacterium]